MWISRSRHKLAWRSRVLSVVAVCLLLAGIYIIYLVNAPRFTSLPVVLGGSKPVNVAEAPAPTDLNDYLIVPKLNLKMPIYSGTAAVLQKGIWHRYPHRGDPIHGGNFILAGHRFQLSVTPWATKDSSPLYNMNRLRAGDPIYVWWHHKLYSYKVVKLWKVAPTRVSIEAPSPKAEITMYSCTRLGSADGRDVVRAVPK